MNKDSLSILIAFSIVLSFIAAIMIVELDIHTWWATLVVLWGVGPIFLFFVGGMTVAISLIVGMLLGN